MPSDPSFLLVTCQMGAEAALKGEIARRWPDFRLSYSRPGFVTFKLPPDPPLAADFDLDSVFARAHSFSLGKVTGDDRGEMAKAVRRLAEQSGRTFDALHVWQRDTATPGFHHFEPGPTPLAAEVRQELISKGVAGAERSEAPASGGDNAGNIPSQSTRPAPRGATILDCIIVEPNEWWIGWHKVGAITTRVPGGMRLAALPPHAVSRAYLKMEEALWWSRLPMKKGDHIAELGCSPGGAAQALLDRGLHVLGVDPAVVHPDVLAHPNFRHLRRRGKEVPRAELKGIRYLVADMNVAPNYTLDTVEALATHPRVRIDGMLLTLKLIEWELAEHIPEYLARISGWGYQEVRARHLQHNRQEICVSVLRRSALRKKRRLANKRPTR